MENYPKIGLVYLSYHSEPYLEDVVSALKKVNYPKSRIEFIIVDNPHPEYGSSARYITENVLPFSGSDFPTTTLLAQEKNLGFAAGNNVGIRRALELGCDFVYLHNNDGFIAATAFKPLVNALEENKQIGAAQSLMLLYPETQRINSAGNAYHFLGIGHCNYFRAPKDNLTLPAIFDSGYVSGAAVMLRSNLLRQHGLLDEDYFLYHEDLEYSLRLQSRGYRTVVVRDSVFYHKYNFGRHIQKFYYIERNRLGLVGCYYRLPTLLLLLPAFIFWELGMLWYAAAHGWLHTKLKTYAYWAKVDNRRLWRAKRRAIQRQRTVSDRRLLNRAMGRINFDDKNVNTPLLRYVANPILAAYWWGAKKLLLW